MIPGMDHCGISNEGAGIDYRGFDLLTALEDWVEKSEPPAQLRTTKLDAAGKPRW